MQQKSTTYPCLFPYGTSVGRRYVGCTSSRRRHEDSRWPHRSLDLGTRRPTVSIRTQDIVRLESIPVGSSVHGTVRTNHVLDGRPTTTTGNQRADIRVSTVVPARKSNETSTCVVALFVVIVMDIAVCHGIHSLQNGKGSSPPMDR